MADNGKIDVDGLPVRLAGNLDSIVGVDKATRQAAQFPVTALPMPQGVVSAIQQQNATIEAVRASQGSGLPSYATRAALPAPGTLPRPAGGGDPLVTVTNDPTAANNGAWRDTGSAWVQSADRVSGLENRLSLYDYNDRSGASYRLESFDSNAVSHAVAQHLAGGSMASLSYSAVAGGMQISSIHSSIYYVVSTPYSKLPGITRVKLEAECVAIAGSSVQFGIGVGPVGGARRTYLYGSTGVITTAEGTTVQTVHAAAGAGTAFSVGDTIAVELTWDDAGNGDLTVTLPSGGRIAYLVTGVPDGLVWVAIRGQGTGLYKTLTVERVNPLEVEIVAAAEARATEIDAARASDLFALRGLLNGMKLFDPVGFSGLARSFDIFRRGDGSFFTGFDFDGAMPFAPAEATRTFYVSPSGSDSNAGTMAAPFRSLFRALHSQVGNVMVWVTPGDYFGDNSWRDANVTATKLIVRPTGPGRIVSSRHHVGLSWVLQSGSTYQATITTVGSVVDAATLTEHGDFTRLTEVASVAAVNAQPGSYYVNGTTIYVRTHNNRAPDASIYVFVASRNGKYHVDNGVAWIEGVDFYAGRHPFHQATVEPGASNTVYFTNCTFKYSGGVNTSAKNGFAANGKTFTYMRGCVAAQNLLDGFSYHESIVAGGPPTAVEIDCIGRSNGFDTGGTNNGSTMHDGGTIIRINGRYLDNQNRDVHDVGNSRSWNLGCTIGGGPVAVASGVGVGDTTRLWLDQCTVAGSPIALTTVISGSDSSSIYTHDCEIDGETEAGSNVSEYVA